MLIRSRKCLLLAGLSFALSAFAQNPQRILQVAAERPSENQAKTSVLIRRDGNPSDSVTVQFGTADGSARAGIDYQATNGFVTLGPNDQEARFYIGLIDNTKVDGDRDFSVTLSIKSGNYELQNQDGKGALSLVVRILDNEINGSNDSGFRPTVRAMARGFLGRYFVAVAQPATNDLAQPIWISAYPDGVARLNADGSTDQDFHLEPMSPDSET